MINDVMNDVNDVNFLVLVQNEGSFWL